MMLNLIACFILTFFHLVEQNPDILIINQKTIIFYPNWEPITTDKHIIHCNTSQLSRYNSQGIVQVVMHFMVDQKLPLAKARSYLSVSLGIGVLA